MKSKLIMVLVMLGVAFSTSQEKNIETQSVSIEGFITHVVNNYSTSSTSEEYKQIHLLLQLSESGLGIEDEIILKQGIKLLLERLGEDDMISIIGFSGLNGIALKLSSVDEVKKIMYTIDDFSRSIKEFHEDGIALAYEYAENEFDEDAVNSILMIRNPFTENTQNSVTSSKGSKKKKNNAVLITAISLLPELIAIIKD